MKNRKETSENEKDKGYDLNSHPVFSFESFSEKEFGLSSCQEEDYIALFRTFKKLGSLTWKQIQESGRHEDGFEMIPVASLKAKLPENLNLKEVMVFRYKGKAPMVGYTEGNTYNLLFIDPDFNLYDH